jgi:paraquat-inducible protein A
VESVACRGCDLLQRIPPLQPGAKAQCGRCGQLLAVRHADPLDRPLALTLAAAIALVIANVSPLMGLSVAGRDSTTTLAGGAYEMWRQGSQITALMVAFCAVVAPAVYVALLLAVLVAVRRPPAPHWVGLLMRWADHLRPWSMNEVLLLGMLVALTKIAQLATVVPGAGMYAVGALVLLLPAIASTFDAREVWRRIAWVDSPPTPAAADRDAAMP